MRALIHTYKYGKVQTLAKPLGRFLRQALPAGEEFDLVVPVPLHWMRQWSRGFNQSELLAREVSQHLEIPVSNALRRLRATLSQAGLSNTRRRKNVTAAFQCRRDVRGRSVLLIDDVMTTGSTASACAIALKRAGASRVALLSLARVDRRFEGARPGKTNSTAKGVL